MVAQGGNGSEYSGRPSGKASENRGRVKAEVILKKEQKKTNIKWQGDGRKQEAKSCAVKHGSQLYQIEKPSHHYNFDRFFVTLLLL
jgi:hypothetical protein